MAWIGITVVLMGTGPGIGIRLIVILIPMAGSCDFAVGVWSAGVSQDTRQAERWRDLKRPAGDRKIEHAQNHVTFLSEGNLPVNRDCKGSSVRAPALHDIGPIAMDGAGWAAVSYLAFFWAIFGRWRHSPVSCFPAYVPHRVAIVALEKSTHRLSRAKRG